MRNALAVAAVLALGACATSETATSSPYGYAAELRDLEAQCDARGGMLMPLRARTANPQTDYACRIHSGPSERVQSPRR